MIASRYISERPGRQCSACGNVHQRLTPLSLSVRSPVSSEFVFFCLFVFFHCLPFMLEIKHYSVPRLSRSSRTATYKVNKWPLVAIKMQIYINTETRLPKSPIRYSVGQLTSTDRLTARKTHSSGLVCRWETEFLFPVPRRCGNNTSLRRYCRPLQNLNSIKATE